MSKLKDELRSLQSSVSAWQQELSVQKLVREQAHAPSPPLVSPPQIPPLCVCVCVCVCPLQLEDDVLSEKARSRELRLKLARSCVCKAAPPVTPLKLLQ